MLTLALVSCEVSRGVLSGKLGCVVTVEFWLLYILYRFLCGCIVIKIS